MTNTDTTAAQLVFVAWGDKYIEEALIALKSFRAFHDIQATLITDVAHTGLPFENLEVITLRHLATTEKLKDNFTSRKNIILPFGFVTLTCTSQHHFHTHSALQSDMLLQLVMLHTMTYSISKAE